MAGILRRVGFEYRVAPGEPWRKGSAPGYGLNLATGISTVGRDRLQLQAALGRGIATHLCDGGMDPAPSLDPAAGTLDAEAVPLLGALAYHDHFWSSTWSTSIGYCFTAVRNTSFQEPTAFHRGDYASVNLLATPVPEVLIGAGLLLGRRTHNGGAHGEDLRVQVSVKYKYGTRT